LSTTTIIHGKVKETKKINESRFCSECGTTTTTVHRWRKGIDGTAAEHPLGFLMVRVDGGVKTVE
jgi:hypothetical protein